MIQFRKVLMISLIVLSANAAKAAGPFDTFLGAYTVLSATCEDGDAGCKEIKGVRVEYLPSNSADPNSRQVLHLTEVLGMSSYASYPMEVINTHDDHYSETAEITGDATYACWQHTLSYESGYDDSSFTDELRSIRTVGTRITYTFFHREQTHGLGGNFERTRSFVLVKRASP